MPAEKGLIMDITNRGGIGHVLFEYSNRALREIVYSPPNEYEEWAREAARSELYKRYRPLYEDNSGNSLFFSAIIRDAPFKSISMELLYMNEKERIPDCMLAYDKFKSLEWPTAGMPALPNPSHDGLQVGLPTLPNPSYSGPQAGPPALPNPSYELNMVDCGNGKFDIEVLYAARKRSKYANMLSWGEWQNVSVKKEQIVQYGEELIAAVSLMRITEFGFSEYDSMQPYLTGGGNPTCRGNPLG